MAFEGMATPLGVKPGPSQRGVPPQWRRWMLALFFVLVAALVLITGLQWSAQRSGPMAVAVIERASESIVTRPATPVDGAGALAPAREPAGDTGGVRVHRQSSPGGGLVIKVPDAIGVSSGEPMYDSRVGERTTQGVLPMVSQSGHKPHRLYSRAFVPNGKPMIAIVFTGMGISPRGTEDAIRRLPSDVTLAFAPYGRDLEAQVNRARAEGHEILLQIPMEPLDYPQSDPGPHTLRAGAEQRENLARLHWLMSRFPGYVGLTNFMGSRLMRDEGAYGALLDEVNRRGLLFLDDGTAAGSLTGGIARKINLPMATADRVMETGGRKTLDHLIAEVESTARERGKAVLTVPALPANIERIAAYEKELAARGLVLAPISAIMVRNAP